MASEAGGMEIDDGMELISEPAAGPSSVIAIPPPPLVQQQQQQFTEQEVSTIPEQVSIPVNYSPSEARATPQREPYRELVVKVHLRRAGRDAWIYLGRAFVTQEIAGHTSRIIVRAATSGKVIVMFSELSNVQAERRKNFVIIHCIENGGVVSWSLNTENNSETLKLLASIELACYRCKQALMDPKLHTSQRNRIDRMIRDDRRRRHKRRREEDAMVTAFRNQQIA